MYFLANMRPLTPHICSNDFRETTVEYIAQQEAEYQPVENETVGFWIFRLFRSMHGFDWPESFVFFRHENRNRKRRLEIANGNDYWDVLACMFFRSTSTASRMTENNEKTREWLRKRRSEQQQVQKSTNETDCKQPWSAHLMEQWTPLPNLEE